jgi:hypothetical protein
VLLHSIKLQFLIMFRTAVFVFGVLASIRNANVALDQVHLTESRPCDLNLEAYLGCIQGRGKFC